jgi:hypothetical protein
MVILVPDIRNAGEEGTLVVIIDDSDHTFALTIHIRHLFVVNNGDPDRLAYAFRTWGAERAAAGAGTSRQARGCHHPKRALLKTAR